MDKTLQDQLTEINNELDAENQKAAEKNRDTVARLEQQQADLLKAIMEQEQEDAKQVRIQTQEVKVESEPIPIAVAGVDLTKLDPDLIQLLEIVTKADRRARLVEFNAEVEQNNSEWFEKLRVQREDYDSLLARHKKQLDYQNEIEVELQEKKEENYKAHETINKLTLEKEDSDSKRDAAVRDKEELAQELKSANEEIRRLNDVIVEYQRAKVFGERQAQKIIDITPEETDKAQNLVDSLVKKFVSTTPIGGNWHEVVDEAGNKMVVHANELQKLEEVQPFRTNTEVDQTNVEPSTTTQAIAIAEVMAPEVHFPVDAGTVQEEVQVADGNSAAPVAGTTVTTEQFQALERRVDYLYKHANIAEVA